MTKSATLSILSENETKYLEGKRVNDYRWCKKRILGKGTGLCKHFNEGFYLFRCLSPPTPHHIPLKENVIELYISEEAAKNVLTILARIHHILMRDDHRYRDCLEQIQTKEINPLLECGKSNIRKAEKAYTQYQSRASQFPPVHRKIGDRAFYLEPLDKEVLNSIYSLGKLFNKKSGSLSDMPLTSRSIAKECRLKPRHATRYCNNLVKKGFLKKKRVDNTYIYLLTQDGMIAINKYWINNIR